MIFCPNCGGEMTFWNMGIYECGECGNMIDIEALEGEK